MNLQLINPFAQNFPERVDTAIDACAQCVSFNGKGSSRFAGNLVAVGRNDGGVSVLDLETRAYVRVLEGHVKAVTSVCWSRNSRYLLSSSRDWNIIIWDILTGDRRNCIRFDAPVLSASLHPRNSKLVLAILQNEAVLVDLRDETEGRWTLDVAQYAQVVEEEILQKTPQELEDEETARKKAKKDKKGKGVAASSSSKKRKDYATVGRFTPRGDLVYVGTAQGWIHVFDTQTKQLVHSESVSSPASIKDIEFDRTGASLVVNANDRSIRVYDILELAFYSTAVSACAEAFMGLAGRLPSEASTSQLPAFFTLRHRFQDLVNKTPWNAIGFTNDGDYIVGGAGHKAAQQVYVWDRANGSLSKILEGPKDCLDDLDWHPIRPILVTASDQGLLHIWVTNIIERYSAYAAGFEELEENLEYQEHEDEFDVEDEEEAERRKLSIQDVLVDVIGAEGLPTVPSELIHAGQPGYVELQMYLASSDAWADAEPDEDDQEDFAPPLDIDLQDYEVEYTSHNGFSA